MIYNFYINPNGNFDLSNNDYIILRAFLREEDDDRHCIFFNWTEQDIEYKDEIKDYLVDEMGCERTKSGNAFKLYTNERLSPKEFIEFAKLFLGLLRETFGLQIKLIGE